MNNIEQYRNRFYNLMESEMGNVKPIISEQTTFKANIPDQTITPEMLSSGKGQDTKKTQQVLNAKYKLSIPVDGNWLTPEYNEALYRYLTDNGITPYVCKKDDSYCGQNSEGQVTENEYDVKKFYEIRNKDLNPTNVEQGQSAKINTTNDKSYDYKLENGKYYYSLKNKNKWTEASGKSLDAIKSKVKF